MLIFLQHAHSFLLSSTPDVFACRPSYTIRMTLSLSSRAREAVGYWGQGRAAVAAAAVAEVVMVTPG